MEYSVKMCLFCCFWIWWTIVQYARLSPRGVRICPPPPLKKLSSAWKRKKNAHKRIFETLFKVFCGKSPSERKSGLRPCHHAGNKVKALVPSRLKLYLEFYINQVYVTPWKSPSSSNKIEFLGNQLINFKKINKPLSESISHLTRAGCLNSVFSFWMVYLWCKRWFW